jgi:hypothetical protein
MGMSRTVVATAMGGSLIVALAAVTACDAFGEAGDESDATVTEENKVLRIPKR